MKAHSMTRRVTRKLSYCSVYFLIRMEYKHMRAAAGASGRPGVQVEGQLAVEHHQHHAGDGDDRTDVHELAQALAIAGEQLGPK